MAGRMDICCLFAHDFSRPRNALSHKSARKSAVISNTLLPEVRGYKYLQWVARVRQRRLPPFDLREQNPFWAITFRTVWCFSHSAQCGVSLITKLLIQTRFYPLLIQSAGRGRGGGREGGGERGSLNVFCHDLRLTAFEPLRDGVHCVVRIKCCWLSYAAIWPMGKCTPVHHKLQVLDFVKRKTCAPVEFYTTRLEIKMPDEGDSFFSMFNFNLFPNTRYLIQNPVFFPCHFLRTVANAPEKFRPPETTATTTGPSGDGGGGGGGGGGGTSVGATAVARNSGSGQSASVLVTAATSPAKQPPHSGPLKRES